MNKEEIKKGYVRVSDVIAPYTDFSGIDQEVLEAKAAIGTEVHAFIEAHYREDFHPITEKAQSYIPSFKSLLQDEWFKSLEMVDVEMRLYDDEKKLTGQVDFIGKDKDGKLHLVDFKTAQKANHKTWPMQLALYGYLVSKNGMDSPDTYHVAHLRKGAAYSLISFEITKEIKKMALSLVDLYWHFH